MSARDLRRQAGQLLIFGFDGYTLSAAQQRFLRQTQPGGVILFARNLESPAQCHALLAACRREAEAPLFTCIDFEGGTVDRFRDLLGPAPAQRDVARSGDRKLAAAAGRTLGRSARALGFNVNFAPVSDLGRKASERVLGSRTASADAEEVTTYVREFLRGLIQAGVMGCGKHFPGLGEGRLDSHASLPVIRKSWERLWAEDLVPYRRLHGRMPFVMVAHAAYPAVTGDRTPASLSHTWIRDVLRRRIGYRGLILSDDLKMGGALAAGSVGEVAVACVRAGADMHLVCHDDAAVHEAHEAVVREMERDQRFAEQVRRAAGRVRRAKAARKEMRRRPDPRPDADTVRRLRGWIRGLQERVRGTQA
jgi:beta-N-acetylhexosaminidase